MLRSEARRIEGGWDSGFERRKTTLLREVIGAIPGNCHGQNLPVFSVASNAASRPARRNLDDTDPLVQKVPEPVIFALVRDLAC